MELQKRKKKKKLFEIDEENFEVDEDSDYPVHEKYSRKPSKTKRI